MGSPNSSGNPLRNVSIDILKLIAVFLVMNSHMGICYPKYGFLSTGGAIGDALFFFASGFTLFLGRDMRFDNWYKRRLNRILPSLIATGIVAWAIWGNTDTIGDVFLGKRYWFIGCILIYYLFLYPIKTYLNEKQVYWVFGIWGVLLVALFFFFYNDGIPFYGGGTFRCLAFFLIMLQGAMMGKKQNEYAYKPKYVFGLITSVLAWYLLFYYGKNNGLLILSFIPLMGICRYLYLSCCAQGLVKLCKKKRMGRIVYVVSQLCLEVYLIQKFIFTDQLNSLFPVNIPIIMIVVIAAAYFVKVFSNFISQTFKSEPYEWGKMLL